MVHVLFTSDDWRDYPKDLEDDGEAWLAANPPRVQYGPFDSVSVDHCGTVTAVEGAWSHTLAEPQYDAGLILWGHVRHVQNDPRKYNLIEIVGED